MTASLRRAVNKLRRVWSPKFVPSYSQSGEDCIVDFLLRIVFQIPQPTYLDVGAHDPIHLSNTYLFYCRGCKGVCVDPDPDAISRIRRYRPNDVCVQAGVGIGAAGAMSDFYLMRPRTLNTFSEAEAMRCASQSEYSIEQVIQVPVISINEIISKYFDATPNFISIDVEGLDEKIVCDFNFGRYRPQCVAIETVDHIDHAKNQNIFNHMSDNGYFAYADTYINTIFVERKSYCEKMKLSLNAPRGVQPAT